MVTVEIVLLALSVKPSVHALAISINKLWFPGPIADFGNRLNQFVKKIRLKRTMGSGISARFLTARDGVTGQRVSHTYLVEDPGELKQVARSPHSRLQHPLPSRRPLRTRGQALVPAGV